MARRRRRRLLAPGRGVVQGRGGGSGDDGGVLSFLIEHSGGKTLHPSQGWVVRAMRALELRYQAQAREEAVQRYNLEVHATRLAHDLGAAQAALREAEVERRIAAEDAERARAAAAHERETGAPARTTKG